MKVLNKLLHWLISPFTVGVAVTFGALYISYQYYDRYQNSEYDGESAFFDLVREMHQKSVDFRLLMRGETPGHPDVAIIAIDEAAIEQEGRWPWPREKTGHVVDKAFSYGAKTIAFDIVFAEEDPNSSAPVLNRLQRTLATQKVMNPDLDSLFTSELGKANSDRHFSEVIQKHADKLVMGAYFEESSKADLEAVSPHVDACIDISHERSKAFQYWKTDQRKPMVRDDHARAESLPAPLADHLNQYMGLLESEAIDRWLHERPAVAKQLQEGFAQLNMPADLPPPVLLQPMLAQDIETLTLTLETVLGSKPEPQTLNSLLDTFATAVSQKDTAIVQARLRQAINQYCFRFLRDDPQDPARSDELLSETAFRKKWGENLDFSSISWEAKWAEANQQGIELPTGKFQDFVARARSDARRNQITPVDKWWTNIPVLAGSTHHSAFFNAFLDSDGTIRRNMFLARRGNHYATSLALTAFLVSHNLGVSAFVAPSSTDPTRKGIPSEDLVFEGRVAALRAPASEKNIAGFQIIDAEGDPVLKVPVDPAARMTINFAGKRHTFPHISAADILSDEPDAVIKYRHWDPTSRQIASEQRVNKAEFLKNKILFFGATATGIFDLRVTPFEENFPGVETHANMLSNLLVEYAKSKGSADTVRGIPGFLRTYPETEGPIMMAAMLSVGLVLSGLLTYFGSVAGLAITATSLGGVYALDRFVLFNSGIVTTVLLPVSQISALFVSLTFYKYFTEERKKRELKGTFEKYVSPAIVAEVLADPSNIELGGKKMDLTVMFSDVRGFTTISEKLDPRALSDLLNSYLTPMTNLVFANKGTLDKYMGDAIMAFWGAPIHFGDHAQHAARCALQMLDKLRELQAEYRAKGLPEIDIGIGLNTGEMSVGNMGSDTVRSYTVMGDAVNLGSRLEGINKQYGTRIIVSEFTYQAIKSGFVCREVDWVRVKGKAQPVRIFELVAEKTVPSETRTLLDTFQKGFEAYHQKAWDEAIEHFTAALNLKPDDEPSQLYLERCQEYKQSPPPEDWDGVCTMTTK
ncbi:MAG: CHASE2 domain-containing protein [Bdellovibrionaceae bacterium]|nr:CHASE2 domain-containing protein [Pseudobdellovibrionaceae bacterium]